MAEDNLHPLGLGMSVTTEKESFTIAMGMDVYESEYAVTVSLRDLPQLIRILRKAYPEEVAAGLKDEEVTE